MRPLILALTFLAASRALADPPTPPDKPEKWEFLGKYHVGVGAGREFINAVIDPDSINRDDNIVHAYVGRDFIQTGGSWEHGGGWIVASYTIDCKSHTYNELWLETDSGFQQTEDKWISIEPDSDVGLAEKRVCVAPHQKPSPRH
jgi:hypothetical protein